MKFFTTVVALASAAVVYAQGPNSFNIPTEGLQTSAGSTLNLTWNPTTPGTVSLYLRSGNSAFLNQSGTIATSLPNNGQYTWSVPSDIVRGSSYAVEIRSDSDPSAVNYTPQFIIDSPILTASTSGATVAVSSTSGTASGSTTAASTTSGSGTTGSVTSSASTGSASGSNTASTTSSRSTASSAGIQTGPTTTGGAARATAMAGMLGVVALGALAL